jgi:hypothetical protein
MVRNEQCRLRPGPCRKLSNDRGDVRSGCQPGHQLLDLAACLVGRARQEVGAVLSREVGSKPRDRREVESAIGQHLEDHRIFPGEAARGDAEVGFGLGQVEHLDAIRMHGGTGSASVEAPQVHLGDVGDELALGATGVHEQRFETVEQSGIGELGDATCVAHVTTKRLTHAGGGPNRRTLARDRTVRARWTAKA